MKLFLALALLGAVSSRRLSEGTLEQEELVEQGRSVLEEELREMPCCAIHPCQDTQTPYYWGMTHPPLQLCGRRTLSHWMDRTPQNYSNWASGNPSSSGETCVALCTADGHWRSTDCQTLLPFICEH
ncbi:unnamed protein product [Caretta caretta]